jgi:hypothetical protein
MKSEITTWLIFYLILMTYALSSKLMATEMARKVMEAKQWPPPEVFSGPNQGGSLLDSLKQPLYGTDAIKIAKKYVIISDVFLWCVVWSFIIFGLFFWVS